MDIHVTLTTRVPPRQSHVLAVRSHRMFNSAGHAGGGWAPHPGGHMHARRAFRRAVAGALGDAYRRASTSDSRLPSLLAGAAMGAAAGAGLTLWLSHQGVLQPGGDASSAFRHPAAAAGLPSGSETLRSFSGYVSCWDARTRNPKWVVERLTAADSSGGSASRVDVPFLEDSGLEARFRSRLEDFRGSGYDRGHLAAAANHKRSQTRMEDTFTLSNVSPQVGAGFNRDYWARLEKYVKDLTRRYEEVFVVTGPLFLPAAATAGGRKWVMQHDLIGTPPRLVSVPTHFFKVVLARRPGAAAVAAFVVPNASIHADTPLTSYVVPLHRLEEAAGLVFFPDAAELRGARAELAQQEAEWMHSAALQLPAGGPPQMLLLPPPRDGGAAGRAVSVPQVAPTDSKLVPLCATEEGCKLPAENWWATGGGAQHRSKQ
jgi:endonuclease G